MLVAALLALQLATTGARPSQVPTLRFEDIAAAAGVSGPLSLSYVHTSSWGDVDEDGWPDLFVGTFVTGPTQVPDKLLMNREGSFVDAGQDAVEISGRAAGSVLVDLDADGDLDLVVSNNRQDGPGPESEPSRLLRNDAGTFVDVTAGSGLGAQQRGGRQVGVLDHDADGLYDLFIVADDLRATGGSVLLHNDGELRFRDVTAEAGIPEDVQGLGLAIGDVTGNGWPDLFVGGWSTDDGDRSQHNWMLVADGDGTYHRLTDDVFDWDDLVQGNEDWVAGAAMADLNRDGRLDLLVGHHFGSAMSGGAGVPLRVYMNRGVDGAGDPVFEDITGPLGLPPIDTRAGHVEIQDFDNDGWPDLYTAVVNEGADGPEPVIFRHLGLVAGDPTFAIPGVDQPHYYAGGPVADFDRDGKLDIFLAEWRSTLGGGDVPSRLMRNTGAPGNWLRVEVSRPGNTMGVGARVSVYESATSRLLGHREISPSFGWSSSQPATAHFGLGETDLVDVRIELPFGRGVLERRDVVANQVLSVGGELALFKAASPPGGRRSVAMASR